MKRLSLIVAMTILSFAGLITACVREEPQESAATLENL